MKIIRTLSRLVFLSLVAAIFTLLTSVYGRFVRTPSPTPRWKLHRSLAPRISQLPEFLGEGVVIALCTVAGRVVFRLRLSSSSPSKARPISLSLRQKIHSR
jgi:hypothetical protein